MSFEPVRRLRSPAHLPQRRSDLLEPVCIAAVGVAALYLGRTVFVPLALSVVLAFVLTPLVQRLRKWGLPNSVAVTVTAVMAFAALTIMVVILSRQVVTFAEDLPRYQYTLADKIKRLRELGGPGSTIARAAETLKSLQNQIDAAAPDNANKSTELRPQAPLLVKIDPNLPPLDQLRTTLALVAEPATTIGFVLVFVIILLLYREDVRDRISRLAGVGDLERTRRAMDDAGQRLNRYFVTSTAINSAFGAVVGIGLWAIGVPNAFLWGVLAMLLRYIPFAGVPIAAVLPLMLATAVDPGWTMVIETLALFALAELITGQIVETVFQGEATGLSPLALILAATFWTLLWGTTGLFLAVPLTVILAVAGRHIERFSAFEILLGSQPALSAVDQFYQRILSGEAEEAADQAETLAEKSSLGEVYDTLAAPALSRTLSDARLGKLDGARLNDVHETMSEFLGLMREIAIPDPATPASADDPGPAQPPTDVVCIPARPGLSENLAEMTAQLLLQKGLQSTTSSMTDLMQDQANPCAIVCVCGLASDRQAAHLKFLVRRLRRTAPQARIIAVLWRSDTTVRLPAENGASTNMGPFDEMASTLTAARDRCLALTIRAPSGDEAEQLSPVVNRATARA